MFNEALLSTKSRLSVLVVDDDPLIGDFIALNLEGLGCEVMVVADGAAALDVLADEDIHLLVTDWQMPGLDGMELVRRVRNDRANAGFLHIAMMTAREDSSVIRTAMESGVDDFLYKPVQPIQLEMAVESARRNRVLHRRLERRNSLLTAAHRRARDALDRVRADLDAATALHERLLPANGRAGALELAHLYTPAAMLGGDSIGFSQLREGGALFFLIDVQGHGVPAALDSFHLHHRLKQLRPTRPENLGQALTIINREILDRGDDSYATISFGLLLPEWEEGWLVSAGHPPPLLVTANGSQFLEGGRSLPVGWFDNGVYEATRFEFPKGARLVLYSDGVTDCADTRGELYGVERLEATVLGHAMAPIGDVVQALQRDLVARRSRTGFEDDISLLVIENVGLEKDSQ